MRVLRFCLFAFLSSALGTSFAQGWSVYADQEYFFSINFIISKNLNFTSQVRKIMIQIVGKTIVVIN